MTSRRPSPYPEAALAWLVPAAGRRVLDLGSGSGAFARQVADAGHRVLALDADRDAARDTAQVVRVTGQAENLPLRNASFDVATSAQTLHLFAPGLAFAEIARVLRPGGLLSVVYNTRDDTVPWVRRLARVLQQVDPSAMSGEFGQSSIAAVEQSPYFEAPEQRSFRNWVPMDKAGLLAMTLNRPVIADLPDDERAALVEEVAAVYESVARPPEPILLPFQASCWRAVVDHRELAVGDDADGLSIPL